MSPNLEQQLTHLHLTRPDVAELIEAYLVDEYRERNEEAVEALESANADQVFSEADSERFDELLDGLAGRVSKKSEVYKSFIQFQTDLLARAALTADRVEVAIKILEGYHGSDD